MKITDVQAILISIPLKKPTSMSNKTVTAREYVVTRVFTDEGITGRLTPWAVPWWSPR